MNIAVPRPFTNVVEVEAGLASLERAFAERGDVRGAFATTYLESTRRQFVWLRERRFGDMPWVERAMVAFANRYRGALESYEAARLDEVPVPWRLALDADRRGVLAAVQNLLLGINAHINHDLPLALAEVGLTIGGESRLDDHQRINETLFAATPEVRRRVPTLYAARLRFVSRWFGGTIDRLVAAGLVAARRRAWNAAADLVAASTEGERRRVFERIHDRAVAVGREIVARRLAPVRWVRMLGEAA